MFLTPFAKSESYLREVPVKKTTFGTYKDKPYLSNRTLHCLGIGCIHKVWQLLDKKETDLKRIRGLGEGCYQEIISALAKHDLEIKRNFSVL
jgi:DNA-directed RNA polymerase alpha subunit